MSRLKKVANNVSPSMHKEVEKFVPGGDNNRSKEIGSRMEFIIAKRLLAELPIVPTNDRVYDLVQDILIGLFDDISSIDDAESKDNWQAWIDRTREILKSKGILD
ncbi:MAG: hypothetical protein ACOCRK_04515 [bacterium]